MTLAEQSAKAPQQRLNVRHIHDPFSKGNTQGGPGSVIHKHSRAIAFSIFRNHSLFSKHHRQHKQPMHTSISILLANKKVQEQYTSTRTTSRLNSHGLLEDVGTMGTTSAYSQSRTMIATASTRSRPPTPQQADGSQSEGYISDQRGQSIRSSSTSREVPAPPPAGPPPVPQKDAPSGSSVSSSSMDVSDSTRMSGESVSSTEASSSADRASTFTSQTSATHTISRQSSDDVDDEDSPPRTSHAEAFATVDSSYLEHMRTRPERRHAEEPASHGLVGVLRRRFLGTSKNVPKAQAVHPPTVPREGNYTPPWLTMAPRSKQEERERVIQNLNESFKDVGLLPTARANKSASKGKRPKHPNPTTIFEKVPTDSLYMLLPLWPGETDPMSSEIREEPSTYFVPVEERQYLLVYYVPFEDDRSKAHDKKIESNKKRARVDTRSPAAATSTTSTERIISLHSFKAVARLVSYADLRETGVRVPAFGLSVTGSLGEATQFLPPPFIREQRLDDIVIGVCYNRPGGVEFIPEGLQKLGLCMPTETPPRPPSNEMDDEQEEEVILTPIGRAAIEMAWLGCMAVSSFGST
ncbi:hypothetical protein PHLGIDRAFT_18940 [Phlebiopsis gigantea 11061_1 CR5-6]|uniref:Uncharacterized protein n=1 Tax=Phlebiopsis gigantea (strain 11061_1 CR5-6) TaxID=745531 RepID=A0A0C3NT64_PHLG1|nr:hypothetical protein PHLGIDRAFT_18940 [Phlebiopsis gigantea 11061_1 CR5-6]